MAAGNYALWSMGSEEVFIKSEVKTELLASQASADRALEKGTFEQSAA